MARFPKLSKPIHQLVLPSTGETLSYRGYTVEEERILLLAAETMEPKSILDAIKQLVNNCVLKEDFDLDTIPQFDIEYIFLKLQSRSSQNFIEFHYQPKECPLQAEAKDTRCKDKIYVKLELDQVKVQQLEKDLETWNDFQSKDATNPFLGREQLKLTEDIGLLVHYPTLNDLRAIDTSKSAPEIKADLMVACIEKIFDKEEVFELGVDFTREELKSEFFASLLPSEKRPLEEFIARIPTIRSEIQVKCSKCDFSETLKFEGIQDFFV